MTELAKRYRMFSGLMFFDIDKMIDNAFPDERPFLYRKLIWNIQRGLRLSPKSKLGQEFAWIVCNLAIKCNIDPSLDNIIPDNIKGGYSDWRTHLDLEFAHSIITDCEHIEKVISYLLGDGENTNYILEEEKGKLIIED